MKVGKYKNILRGIVYTLLPMCLVSLFIWPSPWSVWKLTSQQKARYTYSEAKRQKLLIITYELIKGELPWTTNAVGMEQDIIELSNKLNSLDKNRKSRMLPPDHWGNPYHIWFNTNTSAHMPA